LHYTRSSCTAHLQVPLSAHTTRARSRRSVPPIASREPALLRWREELESELRGVLSHPRIRAEDDEVGNRVPEQERAREVDGIESSHGLDRERLLGAGCHLGRKLEQGPPGRGLSEDGPHPGGIGLDEILEDDRSPDRPMTLDERQAGADDLRRRAKRLEDLLPLRLVEQPAEDTARLGIDAQDSARSASSRAWLGRRSVARLLRYARESWGRPSWSSP
jgi:hypothetical protein